MWFSPRGADRHSLFLRRSAEFYRNQCFGNAAHLEAAFTISQRVESKPPPVKLWVGPLHAHAESHPYKAKSPLNWPPLEALDRVAYKMKSLMAAIGPVPTSGCPEEAGWPRCGE